MNYGYGNKGKCSETFVSNLFKAKPADCQTYDLESKNYLIEVKSCKAVNGFHNKRNAFAAQLGRFKINTSSHIMFFLKSVLKNKAPIYIFVLRINNNKIWVKRRWEDVQLINDLEILQIPWTKIFHPEMYEGVAT